MKVKLLTVMAGPNGVVRIGDVVDVTDALGDALVKGGYAIEQEFTAEDAKSAKKIEIREEESLETTDGPKPTEIRNEPAGRRGGKKK